MKMVKSLLLGTAAGFVATAGAQAADLPVKAKPVQYVKICSLYGAGFYYIPGTDMCLKIGGWVRLEVGQNYNGNFTTGPFAGNLNNRTTNDEVWRTRGYITADARNQTEYGTLRSYIAVGINSNDVANGDAQFNGNRGFIQWAGFTFGLATSFYDFYSSPATAYFGTYPGSDTGDGGWKVAGYTAQFGNGLSGTIAAEVARRTAVGNMNILGATYASSRLATNANKGIALAGSIPTAGWGTAGTNSYSGFDVPDVVGNLRLDQKWGSAQIMAAWHLVSGNYYSEPTKNFTATSLANTAIPGFAPGDAAGHPGDQSGYALGAGIKLLNPMWGAGDYLQTMISFTHGASRYNFQNPNFNPGDRKGNNISFAVLTDAVYGGDLKRGNTTGLHLTDTWAVNAAYEHFWPNPSWRTSVYGGYAEVTYDAQASAMICANIATTTQRTGGTHPTTYATGQGTHATAQFGCNADWNVRWIGTRTQWNVTKDFLMGLDVLYQRFDTMSMMNPSGKSVLAMPSFQSGNFANTYADNLGFRFRIHRDFYP
jgi:hypothetical protein